MNNHQSITEQTIQEFLTINPGFQLSTFNFFQQEAVDDLLIPSDWEGGRESFLREMKTLQRLTRLTRDWQTALRLKQAGLHSAIQIAGMSQKDFLMDYVTAFSPNGKTAEAQAQAVYQQAVTRKSKAVLDYTALQQHNAPHYKATRLDNLSDATTETYSDLPDYDELFGDQNYCDTPECRSIFSPAAYFVDLMRLQAAFLNTTQVPTMRQLQTRRPDLWNLLLNCENTDTLISKLEIVNEVLALQYDPNKTEAAVIQELDSLNYPFALPYLFPQDQIQTYLAQDESSLPAIWHQLDSSQDYTQLPFALESLSLSPAQWNLYSVPDTKAADLEAYYGITGLSAQTNETATLCMNEGQLFMAWQGVDNSYLYYGFLDDAYVIQELKILKQTITGAPSAIAFEGNIYLTWGDASNALYVALLQADGTLLVEKLDLTGAVSNPRLTISTTSLYISYLQVSGEDQNIYYGIIDPTQLNTVISPKSLGIDKTQCAAPIAIQSTGDMYAVYKGNTPPNEAADLYFKKVGEDSISIAGINNMLQAPAMISVSDTLYVAWLDTDSKLNFGTLDTTPKVTTIHTIEDSNLSVGPDLFYDTTQKQFRLTWVDDKALIHTTLISLEGEAKDQLMTTNSLATLAEADTFLSQTDLTRDQLDELLYQALSSEELNDTLNADFFINVAEAAQSPVDQTTDISSTVRPALGMFQGKLYIGWQDPTTQFLKYGWLDAQMKIQEQGTLKSTIMGSPTLAVFNDQLYFAWVDAASSKIFYSPLTQQNTLTAISLDIPTSQPPTLSAVDQSLYIVYTDKTETESGFLYMGTIDTTNHVVMNPLRLDGNYTSTQPYLASTGDDLVLAFKASTNESLYTYLNLLQERSTTVASGSFTLNAPSVAALGQNVYLAWVDSTNILNYGKIDLNQPAALKIDSLGKIDGNTTTVAPTLATDERNSQMYLAWVDGQNLIHIRTIYLLGEYSVPIHLNPTTDILENLFPVGTHNRIDHVHRFIRLVQSLDWSFTDMDWALRTVSSVAGLTQTKIDAAVSPYLAWIYDLVNTQGLQVNQVCALIGIVKDFGKAHGPSFFQSIFNSSKVLNPPQWVDPNTGAYNLSWKFLERDEANLQIQDALSAALGVSQDELMAMAHHIYLAIRGENNQIPLTLGNLSIFYRISLLPEVVGLPILDCMAANALLHQTDLARRLDLYGGEGAKVFASLHTLMNYQSWLQETGFGAGQVQYILTGSSNNLSIQNAIIGPDTAANFLNSLNSAVAPSLLLAGTFDQFADKLFVSLNSSSLAQAYIEVLTTEGVLEKQLTRYKVIQPIPDMPTLSTYIVNTLPEGTRETNEFIIEMSRQVQQLLNSYPEKRDETLATLISDFENIFSLYAVLGSQSYVDEQGVVLTIDPDRLSGIIPSAFVPVDENSTTELRSQISDYYYLQQKTLTHHLASLYGVAEEVVPVLESWGGLSFGDIRREQIQPDSQNIPNYAAGVALLQRFLSKDGEYLTATHTHQSHNLKRLEFLQRYAFVVQLLSFSSSEAMSLLAFHGKYDIRYVEGTRDIPIFQLNFQNLQTLFDLSQFLQTFEDDQNHFIFYLNSSKETENETRNAEDLSQITDWDVDQIRFLLLQWTEDPYFNISHMLGVVHMWQWFDLAEKMNLSIPLLWKIYQLAEVAAPTYEDFSEVADIIWGGWIKKYEEEADVLSDLTNTVNQNLRDHLLPLVISQLNQDHPELNILTPRDLYQYLLIDVEVNGVVQTSKVKEAISAIQLYLYRSLNNLETDIVISQEDYIEFSQWWEWMRNYRVWQANREVFLYPENYIQPELRANVTPQFEQLVNDLKQVDLTNPASIDQAYRTYLDGFSTVASLQIVGAGAQTHVPNSGANESLTKELCIIGKTDDQPYSYYYRTVLLAQTVDAENTNPYAPTDWGAWQEVNCHMQPIGPVTPVFAFGKWFVFWVERQENSETTIVSKDGDDNYINASEAQYEFTIMYSYLDFNQNWIAAQKVAEPITKLEEEMNVLWTSPELIYFDRTYPSFFNSAQTIIIPYGEGDIFEISEGTLGQGVEKWTRFEGIDTSYLVDASLGNTYGGQYQNYQYGSSFGPYYETFAKTGALTLDDNAIISNGVVDICEYEDILYCAWNDNNKSIKFGYLNEVYEVQDSVSFTFGLSSVSPALIEYNDRLYVFGVNNLSQLFYGWVDTLTSTIHDVVTVTEILDESGNVVPSLSMGSQIALAVFNGSTYVHFIGSDSLSHLGIVSENSLIDVFQTSGPAQLNGIGLQTFEDKLFFYVGNTSNSYVYQFSLDKYGQIQVGGDNVMKSNGLNVATNLSPSVAVDNGQMVFAWTELKDSTNQTIKYGYFNPNPDLNNILSGEVDTTNPSNNRPNIKPYKGSLYMIWADKNANGKVLRLPRTLYTLSLWFQLNQGASGPQPILSDATKNIVALSVEEDPTGMLTFKANNGTTTTAKAQGQTWNHVVVTLANGVSSLYCNGILLSSTIPAIPLPDSLILGQLPTEKQNFLGVFQEVLFYTRSLVAGEVTELYTNGVQQITYDFEANLSMKAAFRGNFDAIPVLGQPNWNILTNDEAEYLSMVSQTSKALNVGSYRLNTTTENALSQLLMIGGTDNLLTTSAQTSSEVPFSNLLPAPSATLTFSPIPSDQMDFLYGGMTPYFWEIFFYSPFLMAHMLQTDQQYQAAKDWYQKIFDPTMRSTAPFTYENDLYWQFLGLRSENNPTLKNELDETWAVETQMDLTDPVQLAAYHNDPFDPHAIARLRPIAYQKSLVLHYIDNLINWGDMLFTQYSMESILEAMMLYVMAYDLLGPQPESQGPCDLPQALTLGEILADIGNQRKEDEFLINLEQSQAPVVLAPASNSPNNYIPGDYFGLPENDQFTAYWNTLEDRLHDIRNSLNIQGQFQQAPLFQPALNPMQLVQQVASGQSVAQALSAIQTSIPFYRFEVMIEKSKALASSVTQLGQSLLTALEKKDAEQLSMLYNTNQQNILSLTETSREDQIKGAQQTILALQAGLSNAQHRLDHYTSLINEGWSSGEEAQVALTSASIPLSAIAQIFKGTAIFGYSVPTIFGFSNGGFKPGDAILQTASVLDGTASILQTSAQLSGTIAGFQRRLQDWQLQQTLAQDDVNNAQAQITSAQYALTQAQQELSILKTNLEQEQHVAEFLRTKFTSQQMYQWMVGRLAAIYFQAYQLAMDFAQQAQKAFQFEQGNQQVFIQKNYWNNLYQGLLTGESLKLDLDRMEMSYMKQNERRYEIEKVISLSQLDPSALRDLKDRKKCTISLTEQNFDEDYPGHYCRQIKSISISMPIVLGPYQTIKATLTQTSNYTILEEDLNAVKYLREGRGDQPNADVLRVDVRANQQVALSQGLNDSGLFQLNFTDPRYLPFEGTGAISSWVLEMNGNNNPDLENLTDVIIRLQYTSKQGSQSFQQGVSDI